MQLIDIYMFYTENLCGIESSKVPCLLEIHKTNKLPKFSTENLQFPRENSRYSSKTTFNFIFKNYAPK